MDSSSDNLTQEIVPCLFISVHHRGKKEEEEDVFNFMKFNEPQTYEAHEMVTVGRKNTCSIQLNHGRVSRLQFQIQAFLTAHSSELQFELKNLSNRFALSINGRKVSYLEKQLLPSKSILQFTDFQFYLEQVGGDSVSKFEVVIKKDSPSFFQVTDNKYPSKVVMSFPNFQHDPREPMEVGEDLDQYTFF
ncbi:TRAF-interacting protein with FHA domain-containing protein A-like [Hypanus sabinus]|uniref:TRAF-interacting protein with FHA domain-containing protein A-like n=1 Tax=Hypanus sabinus TaxID=79690 RepID=UPI0028C3D7CD|nr:TRAF-interacting protein with FHA domain-containing protein A-like [Hypanus sabinus]XP_059846396.1 TRAF-interacting protein with FHA domain-containing protein A-like [Hypanus sabinus]XP_059846397.1 TRAF-interacting protein with FHA domain-containing protein A-like [Hypanus sabinus]XP_059846399.1 TRAF-interacting protein with FHA domain-containing protein A-like [Hypanus sabinus]